MNRQFFKSPIMLAAAAAWLAAGPAGAAERGGSLRQEPLQVPGGQSRVPVAPPQPRSDDRGQARPVPPAPGERRAPGSTSITFKGTQYVVSAGQWYVRRGEDLVAVAAPAGVLVPDLPEGHSMQWIDGVPYFHADGLYYVWRERSRRYEIMQNPPAAVPAPVRELKPDAGRKQAPAP